MARLFLLIGGLAWTGAALLGASIPSGSAQAMPELLRGRYVCVASDRAPGWQTGDCDFSERSAAWLADFLERECLDSPPSWWGQRSAPRVPDFVLSLQPSSRFDWRERATIRLQGSHAWIRVGDVEVERTCPVESSAVWWTLVRYRELEFGEE